MRANEFLLESEVVQEIERISKSGYEGGKEDLTDFSTEKIIKPLPGKSGFLYSINGAYEDFDIKLWDPINKGEYEPMPQPEKRSWHTRQEYSRQLNAWAQKNDRQQQAFNNSPGKLIGQLVVSRPYNFPLKNALQVNTITTDEDYRGRGLGTALYGIVLAIMKRPLLAGSSQTPDGRAAWVRLNNIPGIQMKGFVAVDDSDISTPDYREYDDPNERKYQRSLNSQASKRIDVLMGQLGGQYIGKEGYRQFFAFDVKPNTSKAELEAYVKTNLTNVYSSGRTNTGLFAVWTGKTHR